MYLELKNTGKRYERRFVFRNLNEHFKPGDKVAILGGNGSGKSTLMKILSGSLTPSEGEMIATLEGKVVDPLQYVRKVAFCGPYTAMIEEFTLREAFQFHHKFTSWRKGISTHEALELSGLSHAADRPIKDYSSGMKQRAKLSMSLLTDTAVLLLDEPTATLDNHAIQWFNELLKGHMDSRTVFIASNRREEETSICTRFIQLGTAPPAGK